MYNTRAALLAAYAGGALPSATRDDHGRGIEIREEPDKTVRV